jgi:predicted ester cyclase
VGVEPTGKRWSSREISFFRLESGKIAEMWYMEDLEAVATQL